jgi:hypothetical protein
MPLNVAVPVLLLLLLILSHLVLSISELEDSRNAGGPLQVPIFAALGALALGGTSLKTTPTQLTIASLSGAALAGPVPKLTAKYITSTYPYRVAKRIERAVTKIIFSRDAFQEENANFL